MTNFFLNLLSLIYSRPKKILFVLVFFVQSFAFHLDNCSWIINVVERDNTSLISTIILPGRSYFLRLQVQCDSKVNSKVARDLALTGATPVVHVTSTALIPNSEGYYVKQFEHIVKTALVDLGSQTECHCLEYVSSISSKTCFCGTDHPTCTGNALQTSSECCQMEQECLSSGFLCNLAWLALLPLGERATVLHISLVKKGIGPDIKAQSFVFHVDGFHDDQMNNTLGLKLDSLPSLESGVIPLNCVPQLSSACVIAGISQSNVVLYSTSEFAATDVVEIQGIFNGASVCTDHYSSLNVIKGALSFMDTIVFNTPVGIVEVSGKLSSQSEVNPGSQRNVLRQCIKHFIGPTEVKTQLTTILAIGDKPNQHKIYIAEKKLGTSLNFAELLDSKNVDVCQFLKTELVQAIGSEPCTVITASSISKETVIVLVELDSMSLDRYHLLCFNGTTTSGQWLLVSSIPRQIPDGNDQEGWLMVNADVHGSNDHVVEPILNGMSHTAIVSRSLFIWGNMLLYSSDAGTTIQRLSSFKSSSNITVFTSSLDGIYALLTDNNELWVGIIGSAKLVKLESSPESWPIHSGPAWDYHTNRTVITMFFDSMNQLQQVTASGDSTQKCVSRLLVPLQDIITSHNHHEERLKNWKRNVATRSSNTSCQPGETTSQSIQPVGRICPYAKLKVVAPRSVNTSRNLRYNLYPPSLTDSSMLHSVEDMLEYWRTVSDTYTMVTPPSPVDSYAIDSELPWEISLYRLESYSFDLYLYLYEDESTDTSRHSWTVDHLQVSFRVSDPSLINVTSTREELLQNGAVKYQVTLQDKGVDFPQNPPGEELVPISLYVQMWNSTLSCAEESQSGNRYFTGSQVMTVFLGCPANRKVVFDGQKSMSVNGKEHYCRPGEKVPCFLFDLAFYPLFNIIDLTNGDVTPYTGQYTLKIVGGGIDLDSIRDYSLQEQDSYNFRTTGSPASLVWAAKEKSLATIPVFNHSTNAMQWLCGTESPCANIDPKFPDNAEYFFRVEFSNKDVGSSNCDYTLRFVIRVHGLPPGSFYPSSIIVMSCIGIMVTAILALFIFKMQDHKLLKTIKMVFSCWIKGKQKTLKQKVAPQDEMELEGMNGEGTAAEDTFRNPVGIAWDVSSTSTKIQPTKDMSKED